MCLHDDLRYLIKRDGTIDGKKLKVMNTVLENRVQTETGFLKLNPTIAQRVKAVFFNIQEHGVCILCGQPLQFSPHKKDFFKSCTCEEGTKQKIHLGLNERKRKYHESIKARQDSFQPSPIFSFDELRELIIQTIDVDSYCQYDIQQKLYSIPGVKESLFFHTNQSPYTTKIVYRLGYMIHQPKLCFCGKPTSFISLKDGFYSECKKHYVKDSSFQKLKSMNTLDTCKEILRSNQYTIINVPNSLQEPFDLKCSKGHEFSVTLNNGRMSQPDVIKILCRKCHPRTISSYEHEIAEFLTKNNITFIQQYRLDEGRTSRTLDFLIPEFKIAIEFDGLAWHSFGTSKHSKFDNHLDESNGKFNHLNKTKTCNDRRILLFHIFENEWNQQKDIWKSMLLAKCGISTRIFARKCVIQEINNDDYRSFVVENHIQGFAAASIKYGLYHNGLLMCIMSFSKNRFSHKAEYEMIRFASRCNHTVIGGFSKLLKHFVSIQKSSSILSYANRRWSIGQVYESNGFIKESESSPNYFYISPDKTNIFSRLKFQRHKLNDTSSKTEKDIMFERGYRRIWDSGNIVYMYDS